MSYFFTRSRLNTIAEGANLLNFLSLLRLKLQFFAVNRNKKKETDFADEKGERDFQALPELYAIEEATVQTHLAHPATDFPVFANSDELALIQQTSALAVA